MANGPTPGRALLEAMLAMPTLPPILTREGLVGCFRPVVSGRPRWLAQYLSQGLCRIKWLSVASILLWIVQALGLTRGAAHELYRPAAEHLHGFAWLPPLSNAGGENAPESRP